MNGQTEYTSNVSDVLKHLLEIFLPFVNWFSHGDNKYTNTKSCHTLTSSMKDLTKVSLCRTSWNMFLRKKKKQPKKKSNTNYDVTLTFAVTERDGGWMCGLQVRCKGFISVNDRVWRDVFFAVRLPESAQFRPHVAPLVVCVLVAWWHLLNGVDVDINVRSWVGRVEHLAEG